MHPDQNQQIRAWVDKISRQTNLTHEDVQKASADGSLDAVLKKLSPSQAQKLQTVLADKAATEKLLNSPQARALLKKFLEKQ